MVEGVKNGFGGSCELGRGPTTFLTLEASKPRQLALHKKSEIPPTAVGGFFQVLSTPHLLNRAVIPPTAVGGYFKLFLRKGLERSTNCRWDSKIILSSFD
jgi:hypothetical protein